MYGSTMEQTQKHYRVTIGQQARKIFPEDFEMLDHLHRLGIKNLKQLMPVLNE